MSPENQPLEEKFERFLQEHKLVQKEDSVLVAVSGGIGVETHVFRNGAVRIVGLHTNPQLRVDELGPPEFRSNERFEKPRPVRLALPSELYVYDLRAARPLGRQKELTVTLDPYEPALYSLTAEPLPALRVSAPQRVARGATARLGFSLAGPSPASVHLLHIDVLDPSAKVAAAYSGNVLAPAGRADYLLPVALSDPPGRWQLRIRDLLSGQVQTAVVEVF